MKCFVCKRSFQENVFNNDIGYFAVNGVDGLYLLFHNNCNNLVEEIKFIVKDNMVSGIKIT